VKRTTPDFFLLVLRLLLLVSAVDSLGWGVWTYCRPWWMFEQIGVQPRNDTWFWQLLTARDERSVKEGESPPPRIPAPRDAGLWHLLAFCSLAHAVALVLAAWRPASFGGLVVLPLVGRAITAGLWLWALGTIATFPENRVPFPHREPLVALAVHEAIWLPLFLGFLVILRISSRSPRGGV
jgi:hypothetical protein